VSSPLDRRRQTAGRNLNRRRSVARASMVPGTMTRRLALRTVVIRWPVTGIVGLQKRDWHTASICCFGPAF
jgi:hypothetical protein